MGHLGCYGPEWDHFIRHMPLLGFGLQTGSVQNKYDFIKLLIIYKKKF